VGMTEHSMPVAEMIGRATVKEHLPTQEMSWIASTRFCSMEVHMSMAIKSFESMEIIGNRRFSNCFVDNSKYGTMN